MTQPASIILQASAVSIKGKALLIEGPPGSGKSSLALALIDRGAELIGDDGVALRADGRTLLAFPPPNIAGLLEVRGVGLIELPTVSNVPAALILMVGKDSERLPDAVSTRAILGCDIAQIPFHPGTIAPAKRAEIALETYGL